MRVRTSVILSEEDVLTETKNENSESTSTTLNLRDIEIINANAERLNKEAADTLEYQAEWIGDDSHWEIAD